MGTKEFVLAIVAPVLLGLWRFALDWVRARVRPSQLRAVYDLARAAVTAAEQFGVDFEANGKTKYEFAAEALQDAAKRVGIKLSEAETFSFIHAALRELHEHYDFIPSFDLGDSVSEEASVDAPAAA